MDCIDCCYGEDVLVSEQSEENKKDVGCVHCNQVFFKEIFDGHSCPADPKARRTYIEDGVVGQDLVLLLQGIADNLV